MWCLSKGSQSTKLRQSTRNQGSSTTQLQQHKGHRQGRTRGSLLPRNSRTRTSTKGQDRLAWRRLHGTSIQTTRTNRQQFKKPSIIPHTGSSGRKRYRTKSTRSSRIIHGISFHAPEIAKSSPTNSHSGTKRTNMHESSG